jgi:hypothetical protein
MKRCIRYLPIAIFLLLATFGESADRQQNSDSKREVWEALQNYETAFMKRDVAALEKIWADDLRKRVGRGADEGAEPREHQIRCNRTGYND